MTNIENISNPTQKQEFTPEEKYILASEKSKSVGDMISGVTHELNNPLAVVIGRVQNAERKIKTNPGLEPLAADLKSIMSAASKMDRIIKSLRLFSKCDTDVGSSHCLIKDILDQTILLLNNKLSKTSTALEIHLSPEAETATLFCNAGQIQTAIFHLVTNAMNATKISEAKITIEVLIEGKNLILNLQDQGTGFSEDARENFAIPFTQKADTLEIHLGLYIAKSQIEKNKGSLQLASSTSAGSTLKIQLPLN